MTLALNLRLPLDLRLTLNLRLMLNLLRRTKLRLRQPSSGARWV
jgi:hypothetical protein